MNIVWNKEYDKILRDMVEKYPRSYFKKIKAKANRHLLDYIISCTPLLDESYLISTRTYWVINHITEFPKCSVCGRDLKQNIKINEGYPRNCSAKCAANDPLTKSNLELAFEKKYGEGIRNPFQDAGVKKKIDDTNFRKYGCKRFTQTEEYRNIIEEKLPDINKAKHITHTKNRSFNSSNDEDIVFYLISEIYPDVKRWYKSELFPYECDFFIESKNLYIDYNGTWTHGTHPFNENNEKDIEQVQKWNEKGSGFYLNAIYTWTDLDVKKRECAKKNSVNRIELWNIEDVYEWLYPGFGELEKCDELMIKYNRKKLHREFEYYLDTPCKDIVFSNRFFSIKFFQQDIFFATEKNMWKNDEHLRRELIENRCRYLNKTPSELTPEDILTGFKKSMLHYGYSHFNPFWFKHFISRFGVKKCYDPCGGWGHRLLGSGDLKLYIYNDLSKCTKENVDRMISYFGIKNTVTYSEDATVFEPQEEYDSIFTCPPYYNTEHYPCGDFKTYDDYLKMMKHIRCLYDSNENCRTMGIVIREDILPFDDFCDKVELNVGSMIHMMKTKKSKEYLYIFRKETNESK